VDNNNRDFRFTTANKADFDQYLAEMQQLSFEKNGSFPIDKGNIQLIYKSKKYKKITLKTSSEPSEKDASIILYSVGITKE